MWLHKFRYEIFDNKGWLYDLTKLEYHETSLPKLFNDDILDEDFQSVIPSTNIMYPVTKIDNLPQAYDNLKIPKVLHLDPQEINIKKENWINEWLNAS